MYILPVPKPIMEDHEPKIIILSPPKQDHLEDLQIGKVWLFQVHLLQSSSDSAGKKSEAFWHPTGRRMAEEQGSQCEVKLCSHLCLHQPHEYE